MSEPEATPSLRLRQRDVKPSHESRSSNRKEEEEEEERKRLRLPPFLRLSPLMVELLRCVLLLVIFGLLSMPWLWAMDWWRGKSAADEARQRAAEAILQQICPPGHDCEHGRLNL